MMTTTFSRGAAVLAAGVVLLGGAGAAAASSDANHPDYWEAYLEAEGYTDVTCDKVADDYDDATWTADADYDLVVLKAGSEQSTETPDELFWDVTAGTELTHASGKEISHVIACNGEEPVTPEEPEEPGTPEEPEEPGTPEEPEEPGTPEEPGNPEEPEEPGAPGQPGDDAGQPIGPIVQTDVAA